MSKSVFKSVAFAIGAFAFASVAMASAVPLRGVVEGYYGRPWGTEGRLSLLEFMGQNKMNVFIYGPKDDPYHHSKWREQYPAKEMADFKRLLAVSKKHNINFYWAIHLGGSFKKGSAADYEALYNKLNFMYNAGFRSFAVFFDDFGSADAEFHAEICNNVVTNFLDKKKDCAPLIMCPNVYWGHGHVYHRTLGEKLDQRVHIMWTGRGICSDIKADDVAKITADFKRPPFIWWNWPVNDYCRTKILLGRTYGLDKFECSGFVSNPMENCEANKIALYSIAKWCLDPNNFDSHKVWEESFGKIYSDKKVAAAMRIFAEHNSDQAPNGHGYRREESVSVAPLMAKAREQYAKHGKLDGNCASDVRNLFANVATASEFLLAELPKERYNLGWEIEGWLEAQKYQMRIGLLVLDLLDAFNNGGDAPKIVGKIINMRAQAALAVDRHKAKFAAATFANDAHWVAKPATATRELEPFINAVLEGTLRKIYAKKTGKQYNATAGFEGFSNVKALPKVVVRLDGKYAGAVRVMEYNEIAPGESFGISIPQKWQADYFHAKLGDNDVVKAGVIELSKDGKVWSKLNTRNHGENMELPLSVADGWHYARYRNVSSKTIRFKINQFKFDVRQVASPIDELLETASK